MGLDASIHPRDLHPGRVIAMPAPYEPIPNLIIGIMTDMTPFQIKTDLGACPNPECDCQENYTSPIEEAVDIARGVAAVTGESPAYVCITTLN